MSPRLLVLLVPLAAVVLGACIGPSGGCPFTAQSATTIEPATPCVTSRVTNGEPGSTAGGCVDPDLVITNKCSDPLVVHGVILLKDPRITTFGTPGDVTIAPGETTYVEVKGKGATSYALAATLGTAPLTIRFSTSD